MSNIKPYEEASEINEILEKLMKSKEITKENAKDWLLFSRTVKSTLNIIDNEAKKHLTSCVWYEK